MVTFDTSRLRYIDKWPYSPNTFSSSNSIQFTSNERRSALLTYKRFRNIDCISPKYPAGPCYKVSVNLLLTQDDLIQSCNFSWVFKHYAIALITIAFDTDFDIALILDLLLKVKELQLLKRVDFLEILDTMSTET